MIPGVFYVGAAWFPPRGIVEKPGSVAEPHKRDYDEVPADAHTISGKPEKVPAIRSSGQLTRISRQPFAAGAKCGDEQRKDKKP
jgi:hypothetical protein